MPAVFFRGTPEERTELRDRLQTAGCAVKDTGADWLSAGNFEEAFRVARWDGSGAASQGPAHEQASARTDGRASSGKVTDETRQRLAQLSPGEKQVLRLVATEGPMNEATIRAGLQRKQLPALESKLLERLEG
jgi:hypothetical protein